VAETRYVLWGCAGHAKVLANVIALRHGRLIATFDNNPDATPLVDVPLHIGESGLARWAKDSHGVDQVAGLVAIGGSRGRDRLAIQALFIKHGLRIGTLIHPSASVDPTAYIGAGGQVLAQAIVSADTVLGTACIVNHKASVDHECVLGDGVHLAPGATLCGLVTVGEAAFIGAGAVVLPRLSIGSDAVIGAGAIVTRDVPPGAVVAGNPARINFRGNE
jgi:sugar O-acyltransferase (sialic acid O-acetyltransferase NeuD family)